MSDINRQSRGEAASNYFDGPPPANPRSDTCWKGRDIEVIASGSDLTNA